MISSVFLAAGLSRRFPGEKLQQEICGKRLIDWGVDHLRASAVDEIVVVVRAGFALSQELAEDGDRVRIVINPRPADGMAGSIIEGVNACAAESAAVLIAHADMPLVGTSTLDQLVSRWRKNPTALVAPRFQGQQGNPVIIPRAYWNEIRALQGDVGCKSILTRHPSQIFWEEFEDDRILFDIDSEEDLAELHKRWAR